MNVFRSAGLLSFAILVFYAGCESNSLGPTTGTEASLQTQVEATELLGQGKAAEAISVLDQAIHSSSNDAQLLVVRGTVLRKTGEYDRAIMDFDGALALNPSLVDAYCQRAFSLQQKGQPGWQKAAMCDANAAIKLDRKNALAYVIRGNAWAADDEFRKAIVDFSNAIRWNPGSYSAYGNRARAYASIGNHDQARQDMDYALSLDMPADERALFEELSDYLDTLFSAVPDRRQTSAY